MSPLASFTICFAIPFATGIMVGWHLHPYIMRWWRNRP
jgi:hypothetical protein